MKKMIITVLSAAVVFASASAVSAEDIIENSAFIGKWESSNIGEAGSAKFYINSCDNANISATLIQYDTEGNQPFTYDIYSGNMKILNDEQHTHEGKMLFNYTDMYGTKGTGYLETAFFVDNIWISAYTDDGKTLIQGAFSNGISGFNPYKKPYSYNVNIDINSKDLESEKKPFIVNGTTYVPLRGTFDMMNLNVYWDELSDKTQMITTTKNDIIVQFVHKHDNKGYHAWTMSKYQSPEVDTYTDIPEEKDITAVQPMILDGTTYVPLRVIAEGYGAYVDWDDLSKTAYITSNTACDTKRTAEDTAAIEAFGSAKADLSAAAYAGMKLNDSVPYYDYKSKYFIYTQDNSSYKVFNNGTLELIAK